MATTYENLLVDVLPRVIETDREYREIAGRFGELLGKGRSRTGVETKLMRLLGVLVEDYDRRHGLPPDDSTPAESLRFLLEHSGKTAADMLPVFHQRSHVNEALNGKRKISPEQAKRLGKMFSIKPALFLSF
jgi:antitoxin component HigA of HigAB toxin-antitoxin module